MEPLGSVISYKGRRVEPRAHGLSIVLSSSGIHDRDGFLVDKKGFRAAVGWQSKRLGFQ